MNNKVPYSLISKNLANESSADEDAELFRWLNGNPEHVKVFEECIAIVSGDVPYISLEEIERRLTRVRASRTAYLTVWKIAASLILIAIVPATLLINRARHSNDPMAVVRHVALPGGGDVWLNKNSRIFYDTINFKNNRMITLEGEAFIRITANQKPILIFYGDGITARVYNCEVNVRAYKNEYEKTAVVSDGFVAFNDQRGVVLEASTDEEVVATVEHGLISSSISINLNFNSWMTGVYAFDEMPLSKIISENFKETPNSDLSDVARNQLVSGVFQLDRQEPLTDLLRELENNRNILK